jgi:hypothetical protein
VENENDWCSEADATEVGVTHLNLKHFCVSLSVVTNPHNQHTDPVLDPTDMTCPSPANTIHLINPLQLVV